MSPSIAGIASKILEVLGNIQKILSVNCCSRQLFSIQNHDEIYCNKISTLFIPASHFSERFIIQQVSSVCPQFKHQWQDQSYQNP